MGYEFNNYDDDIIIYATAYGIPSDLLKSLIHQEALKKFDQQLGQRIFVARSYRYEAHTDYDWYSRQSPSVPATSGWRGLGNYPEKQFAIAGHVVTGESIKQGDQVPSDYLTWSEYTAAGKLKDASLGVTAAKLVASNPHQGWPSRPNWDFTAQLVLAASYGLGQTLYETAVNRGFDTRIDTGKPAVPVENLFEPKVSVELGAKSLKKEYDRWGNWADALFWYNGGRDNPDPAIFDSRDYANAITTRWNNGNGIYKQVTP